MAKLIAMYGVPADPAAFDRHQCALPKCTAYTPTFPRRREPSVFRHTPLGPRLRGDDEHLADIQAALAAPEGQATAADLANFATGGPSLYIADTKAV